MNSGSCSLLRSCLKIRQITLLVHLYEERSVLRAAKALGITQPAASKQLKEMEDALQVQLFERHPRGIVPTSSGEVLARHARSILSELDLAQQELTGLRSGFSGHASLGTVTTPAANLVPTAIQLLKEQHPKFLVSVELDHSRPLLSKLLEGQLDVIVARIPDAVTAENLQFEPLRDERYAVVVGPQQALANRHDAGLEDLLEYPWILPPSGSVLRERLAGSFMQRGLPLPANVIQTQSLPVIAHLLRASQAVAVLQYEAVQPLCESGLLCMLIQDLGLDTGCFGIVTRKSQRLSPGGRALLDCLKTAARKVYEGAAEVEPPKRRMMGLR